MANYVPIKTKQHKNLKVSNTRGFAHIAEQHIAGANAKEYSQLAASFPIFFIKEGDVYRSVILLGLQTGENLYFQEDRLMSLHIPQALALSPFGLGLDSEKENTLTACIDIDSEYVGEDKDVALFDEDGSDSEVFKSIQESLGQLYENEIMTEKLLKELEDHDLIQEFEILMNLASGEKKRLVGVFGINEKKIHELTDEQTLDFHKRGLFIPIHSMMVSIGQLNRLVQLRNEYSKDKIAGIKLQPRTEETAK